MHVCQNSRFEVNFHLGDTSLTSRSSYSTCSSEAFDRVTWSSSAGGIALEIVLSAMSKLYLSAGTFNRYTQFLFIITHIKSLCVFSFKVIHFYTVQCVNMWLVLNRAKWRFACLETNCHWLEGKAVFYHSVPACSHWPQSAQTLTV